jgi:hypothetical protein
MTPRIVIDPDGVGWTLLEHSRTGIAIDGIPSASLAHVDATAGGQRVSLDLPVDWVALSDEALAERIWKAASIVSELRPVEGQRFFFELTYRGQTLVIRPNASHGTFAPGEPQPIPSRWEVEDRAGRVVASFPGAANDLDDLDELRNNAERALLERDGNDLLARFKEVMAHVNAQFKQRPDVDLDPQFDRLTLRAFLGQEWFRVRFRPHQLVYRPPEAIANAFVEQYDRERSTK